MIYSDRQYSISRAELTKLRATLDSSKRSVSASQPWLQEIESNALKSQIAEIEAEIAEYDLKRGQITFAEACALSELPRVLVQARIAKGLSQTDLAERLDMKPQQVQRYEATNYMSASLARLIEVAQILDVKISESFETAGSEISGAVFSWSDVNDIAWSRLPLKEMISRKWFTPRTDETPINAARDFFLRAAGSQFATALHRKKVRSGSVPNEYALLAWQARVLDLAQATATQPFELNDRWLGDLVQLTRLADGPKRARDLLAKHGIALVFEPHLAGTYLDGAAMLSNV
jgi:HTH-type transcriptional regulator / antitoxin HigA